MSIRISLFVHLVYIGNPHKGGKIGAISNSRAPTPGNKTEFRVQSFNFI